MELISLTTRWEKTGSRPTITKRDSYKKKGSWIQFRRCMNWSLDLKDYCHPDNLSKGLGWRILNILHFSIV